MIPDRIILMITDDQRLYPDGVGNSTMDVLPNLVAEVGDRGATFPNFFVTSPLCGPSRCSIYSGLYASQHGGLTNDASYMSAWSQFYSVQRRLQLNGWRTGIVGKFVNTIPATDAAYFDFALGAAGQSTDEISKLRTRVAQFFAESDGRPEFLALTTAIPHEPYLSSPVGAYTPRTFTVPDSYAEASIADKHPSVAAGDIALSFAEDHFDGQMRELAAWDELVPDIFDYITASRDQTLVIFCSDNGFMWGEHKGLASKQWPYMESISCPLLVSWPDVISEGSTDSRLVANIDLAPTILDAAGLEPDYPMPGFSLLGAETRDWLYTEMAVADNTPAWRGYLSLADSDHYIEWMDGWGVEAYDLSVDSTEELASNTRNPTIEALLDGVDVAPYDSPVLGSPPPCG